MEARIQALPEVKEATITFTTNQLQVVTEGDKDLLEEFQKICAAIESEVIVKRKVSVNKKEEKKKREQEQQEKKREQQVLAGTIQQHLKHLQQKMVTMPSPSTEMPIHRKSRMKRSN